MPYLKFILNETLPLLRAVLRLHWPGGSWEMIHERPGPLSSLAGVETEPLVKADY